MLSLILLTTVLYYDAGVNLEPYLAEIDRIPSDCVIGRIDIVKRTNVNYFGYAWYSGRIIIYDTEVNKYFEDDGKRWIMRHEIGHVCAANHLRGTYNDRELVAEDFANGLI
jgi:hypothetical protein